jgi:hypothetical protein
LGDKTSPDVCAFHQAMYDLHSATIRALSRWTLKQLATKPTPQGDLCGNTLCRMSALAGVCEGCPSTHVNARAHTAHGTQPHKFRKS